LTSPRKRAMCSRICQQSLVYQSINEKIILHDLNLMWYSDVDETVCHGLNEA
jgi:hypothetical protein